MSLSVMLSGWKMLNPFTPPKTISAVAESVRCPDFEGVALQLVLYRKMPDRVIPGIEAGDSVAADPEGSVVVLLQALQFVIEEPGVGCVETAETGRFPPQRPSVIRKRPSPIVAIQRPPPLFPVTVNRRDEGIELHTFRSRAFVAASSIRWQFALPSASNTIRFSPSGFRSRWSYCR